MDNIQVYGGQWKVDKCISWLDGILKYDSENRVIILELVIPATDRDPMPGPYREDYIAFISGMLSSGRSITLYDCRTHRSTSILHEATYQEIYAKYAFWDLKIQSIKALAFRSVTVDFGDILNWYGLCHFERPLPTQCSEYHYVWKASEPVTVNCNDNLRIVIYPIAQYSSSTMYNKECHINQNVIIEFDYSIPASWDSICQDVQRFQYLIGLGIEQPVEIVEMKYAHNTMNVESGEIHDYQEYDIMIGTERIPTQKSKHPFEYLFGFKDFKNIENGYQRWISIYDTLKPVVGLYFALYHKNTLETSYLIVLQALEIIHARFFASTLTEYNTRVISILSSIQNDEEKEIIHSLLLKEINPKQLFLKYRLADLFYSKGDLPIFQVGSNLENYIKKIADTRNYYTHYDEKRKENTFTDKELPYAFFYLLRLLEYHLLLIIGMDKSFALRKIRSKYKQIRTENITGVPRRSDSEENES